MPATSSYTVIQYHPDPLAQECLNIGVIAYGGGEIRSHFISDWRRVRQFGGETLNDVMAQIEEEGVRSKWQQRMRSRLNSVNTPHSRT